MPIGTLFCAPLFSYILPMCDTWVCTCTVCSCACTVCTAGACRMCWLPADHAVQPGRNTSCIQAAHYAKCPHCVHNTLCPDAGCATVHGQDVFCPQTERTLHIVLSDEQSWMESEEVRRHPFQWSSRHYCLVKSLVGWLILRVSGSYPLESILGEPLLSFSFGR